MSKKNKDDKLEVIYKKIEDITPYANNPRRNDQTALKLRKSIQEFGFKNPIILDDNDVIVSGHARLKAAIMLGMQEVPCVYANGLTEAEIKAFRLADNKTAEIAGWNYDKLCEEMSALNADGFNLDFSGFNEAEQFYYLADEALPEKVDKQEYKEYQQEAEKENVKGFVTAIICESDEDKEYLKALIHESKHLLRVYTAAKILEMIS